MSAAVSAARRRHPSGRWPSTVDALSHRVAQFLELRGAEHADVAASILEVRGRSGLGVEEFAHRLHIDVDVLRRVEAGEISDSALPRRLRQLR